MRCPAPGMLELRKGMAVWKLAGCAAHLQAPSCGSVHLKFASKAGLASTACPRGVSSLKHEVLDDPVELHTASSAAYGCTTAGIRHQRHMRRDMPSPTLPTIA